jgi:tape measure domain-containing protein
VATSSVDIVVKTRGQRELEALHKSLVGTGTAAEKVQSQLGSKLTSAFQRAGAAGAAAGRQIKAGFDAAGQGLTALGGKLAGVTARLGGLRGALLSVGIGAVTQQVIRGAASFEQLQLRIASLSKEYGETARLQDFVGESAKQFGQSQQEAAAGVADVYARLRPLGISLEEIETVYKGFNATALASGTSAEAASSAFLQLSQALGSGTLQGDEFRSIAEQVPGILRLVAEEMGVSVGELKKLGSEGKITADIMINALAKGFELNKDKIQEMLELSPAQKFKEFQNAASELSNALGSELLPALIPVVKGATDLLREFGKLPGPVKTITAAVLALTAAFVALAPAISAVVGLFGALTVGGLIAAAPWVALAAGVVAAGVAIYQAATAQEELNNALAYAPIEEVKGKIIGLQDELAAAETKLLNVQQQFGAMSREAAFAQASVDALRAALEQAQGDYRIRLLYQEVGVTPTSGYYGPGFNAPKKATAPSPRPVPTGGGGGSKSRGGGGGSNAAAEEAKRTQERIAALGRELQFEKQLSDLTEKRLKAELEGDRQTIIRLQGEERLLQIQKQIAEAKATIKDKTEQNAKLAVLEEQAIRSKVQTEYEYLELEKELAQLKEDTLQGIRDENALLEAKLQGKEKEYELQKKINDLVKAGQGTVSEGEASALAMRNQELTEQVEKLEETKAMWQSLADTVENEFASAMSNAITGLIDGTMTAEEAFSQMFKNIGKAFIDMATQMIAKALVMKALGILTGGGGGGGFFGPGFNPLSSAGRSLTGGAFADGGVPPVNQPSIVGERGPELFVPGQQGLVVPNDIFDATRQALSSGGGPDQAFSENSEALAVANSYTRERMFERERQTILTGAGGSTTVQTQVINNVEYATIDQVQEVADLSAKKARAQVFSDMRNRPSTRASLGMG